MHSPTNQIDAPLCVLSCDYKTGSGGVNLSVLRLLPLRLPKMMSKFILIGQLTHLLLLLLLLMEALVRVSDWMDR